MKVTTKVKCKELPCILQSVPPTQLYLCSVVVVILSINDRQTEHFDDCEIQIDS